jgi:hypothetical protein
MPPLHDLDNFHIVEKRITIFSAEIMAKLAGLGVQISGGSGKIHAHIWIPKGKEMEVFQLLSKEGFYEVEPERHKAEGHKEQPIE